MNKSLKVFTQALVLTIFLSMLPAYANCNSEHIKIGESTVANETNGLMWTRCLFGQTGRHCESGIGSKLNWVDAVNKARGSEHSNYQNWRLPKIVEIEALLQNCLNKQQLFPGIGDVTIWSSTGNIDFNTKAWAFNLVENKRELYSRDSERSFLYFLLVRNMD